MPDEVELAVLNGGPMDGREHDVEPGALELWVVMTDGQRHRYRRTGATEARPDGRRARVFAWLGRQVGPG